MLSISIDQDRCTLCGACVDACPVSCFAVAQGEVAPGEVAQGEDRIIVQNLDQCLVCRNCEDHCRPGCLEVGFADWPHRSSIDQPILAPQPRS